MPLWQRIGPVPVPVDPAVTWRIGLTTRRVTLSAAHVLQETARPRVEHLSTPGILRNPKAPVGFLDGELGEFHGIPVITRFTTCLPVHETTPSIALPTRLWMVLARLLLNSQPIGDDVPFILSNSVVTSGREV